MELISLCIADRLVINQIIDESDKIYYSYSTSVKIGPNTQKVYGAGSYRMYHNCSSATNAQITLNRTVNGASCSVRGKITY